jgi:hypothetical protein
MSRFNKFLVFIFLASAIIQSSCDKQMESAKSPTGAGGSLARFAIIGNYLYVVSYADLDVYDMSDPSIPLHKKTVPVGFAIETIFPFKNKLFIGSEFGMYIFSLDNPENPTREGTVQHIRSCDPVVANDSLAYVTLSNMARCGGGRNELHVYGVKSLQYPVLLYTQEMKSPGGLGVKQNALYVCEGINGMAIFDLKNPARPKLIHGLFDDNYLDVIPYGDLLIVYVQKGVKFYDITDPLKPAFLSEVKG